MLSFTIFAINFLGAKIVEMTVVDDMSCWVKIYQQSGIYWRHAWLGTCSINSCKYETLSTDYVNFDYLSQNEDNGFAFYMKWDDLYFISWNQTKNPLDVPPNSIENLVVGDYGISKTILQSDSALDFRGLGRSSEVGILLDGRGNGSWFVVVATDGMTIDTNTRIPGWKNLAGDHYMANTATLYLWKTDCGSFVIPTISTNPPTDSPTANPSPIPTPIPSLAPTLNPTASPTDNPTVSPTTSSPSYGPSSMPSTVPTLIPTTRPTPTPSSGPSLQPTRLSTLLPSPNPSISNGDSQVVKGNDNAILYMLVGFSLGCFLVLLIAVLLRWRRFDVNRPKEMKKTIVELGKMTGHRAMAFRDRGVSMELELEYPSTIPKVERNSASSISHSLSNLHRRPTNFDPNSHLYVEGRLSNHSYQQQKETRRRSISRSRTHTYSTDRPLNEQVELERVGFDEVTVLPKRKNTPMRISLTPRMTTKPQRKIMEDEKWRKRVNGTLENETDESWASGVKRKKFVMDTNSPELKPLPRGEVSTYFPDNLFDLDCDPQSRSGSRGDIRSRSNSRVLTPKTKIQGADRAEGQAIVGDFPKWGNESSREPQSSRSVICMGKHNNPLLGIHFSSPSKTYSDTSPHKDISRKDDSVHTIPFEMDLDIDC